jgi:acyl-lipid omega-6 desaturase (Delta-12 desaturase)
MVYAYLFVNEQVSLPQHTGLFPFLSDHHPDPIPFHEQDSVTRTTASPGLLSVVLSYNFNLHNEHHLFPSVPWYWLPHVTKRVRSEATYRKATVVGFMVSIRTKDPVAIYTKALPPHGTPPDDDDDSGTSGAHDIVPAS